MKQSDEEEKTGRREEEEGEGVRKEEEGRSESHVLSDK